MNKRMCIIAVHYFIFSCSWAGHWFWLQRTIFIWSSHKPPRKKPSIYSSRGGYFRCPSLLHHVQKSLFGSFWSDPFAGWLHCEWCVYDEGLRTNAPQHPSINSFDALICSGSALHVSCTLALCVFSGTLLQPFRPSVFPCVACNTRYLSPSNIYPLSIVHLRSVYMSAICMRPEITSVMASHSTEISPDAGNLSAWE